MLRDLARAIRNELAIEKAEKTTLRRRVDELQTAVAEQVQNHLVETLP